MAKNKKASAEAQACDTKLTKMQKARESYYNTRNKFFEGKATKAQADEALDKYNECKEEYHDSLRDLARKVVKEHKDSVVDNSKSAKSSGKRTCKPKTDKPAQTSPKTAAKSSDKKSYTVKQGRTCKTFATEAEAKAYKALCKNKSVTITEGTKKPTHRLVKFTARK